MKKLDKKSSPKIAVVSSSEKGMKLIKFLERHLEDEQKSSHLHRWIRTGQVRVDMKRAKAFQTLDEGQEVRFPPFAKLRLTVGNKVFSKDIFLGADLPVLVIKDDILVLNKPSGLAVHGGTGVSDSVSKRLKDFYVDQAYIPAPAHRLDKKTSGLLLVGLSHEMQVRLHAAFHEDKLDKEYLCWVQGEWSLGNIEMLDRLEKSATGMENMEVVRGDAERGSLCRAEVEFLRSLSHKGSLASLLKIKLITGRTHQIRAQLSSRGYPVMGDVRYGGPRYYPMLLHSYRLRIFDKYEFKVLPDWDKAYNMI